jgi:hypothetical protein
MENKFSLQFYSLGEQIIAYLPSLLAGIVLVLVGWILGWFAKRIVIQLALILKLDRLLIRSRWSDDFSKGDVRFGFYNFLGNIAFFVIFLTFFDNALSAWKLTVLAALLERGILYVPKVISALAIFGIGWMISSWAGRAILRSLKRESIPRATLISRFLRTVLLLLFSTMALVELDIARQIVLIGFATIFITLGVLTVVITAIGGREFIQKIQQSLEDEP